ncbi:hypothetical protein DM02DRAFT_722282 [Periconia macrospinosa]|uniref:Uncharacterized protein n=1 Tax=Periconia macrospinosa TaxID=97972 RepID=A0A2V1D1G7_9PLEO|nr:hypothetical protein DM02DRAFT_722282 [Periconia macrospinosa]
MHALVQLATRKWLEVNSKLKQWKRHFVTNLCAAFPVGRYENWAVCQALFPHAQAAADNPPKDETSLEAWVSVREMILGAEHRDTLNSLNRVGTVLDRQGQYSKACAVHQRALEAKKRVLGYSHPDTLTNIANLASTYRNRGRWEEAEALFVQVMETIKTKLGDNHPDTLTSMKNLAFT